MQVTRWTMMALMMVFVLSTAEVGWADRQGAPYRGGERDQEQVDAEASAAHEPIMYHIEGMMRHMRGMMRGLQGMMGDLDDDDEEDAYDGRMRGRGMMDAPHGHGMMGYHGRGHGYRMLHKMERLTRELGLSEQQEKQIRSRIRDHMKQAIQMRAELATQRIELQAQLEADKVDMANVKALLQKMAAQQADLRFAHLSLMQEIKQQLTPEQQQKFRHGRGYMMHDERHMGAEGGMQHGRHEGWHDMGRGRHMRRGPMHNPCGMQSEGGKER